MTLREYAAPIRSKPVGEITTADVLAVLTPIWHDKPETASRLRGRIEAVLASAQVDGWIPEDKPNPARWKNWLDRRLPQPRSSERAAITRRWRTRMSPPSWRGSPRSTARRQRRCKSLS